jgi:hypothetical protein
VVGGDGGGGGGEWWRWRRVESDQQQKCRATYTWNIHRHTHTRTCVATTYRFTSFCTGKVCDGCEVLEIPLDVRRIDRIHHGLCETRVFEKVVGGVMSVVLGAVDVRRIDRIHLVCAMRACVRVNACVEGGGCWVV